MFTVKRALHNPVLMPSKERHWESMASFNWCPVKTGKKIEVLYRAMGDQELLGAHKMSLSTIGYASSFDGEHFEDRRQLIIPEHPWEKFGCEDPRITKIGGTYVIFYTALSDFPFSSKNIKVAVALSDDLITIREKHLATPFNAKAMALFPKKINGKYTAILSVNTDNPPAKMAIAQSEKLEDFWNEKFWTKWYENLDKHVIDDPRRSEGDHVENGAVPIETKDGWLLVYSHISEYFSDKRSFGIEALLLDKKNPRKIIGRTIGSILSPEDLYEMNGLVPNVIFPSGAIKNGKDLDIYYGAADTTSCKASVNLNNLLIGMQPKKRNRVVKKFKDNPIITPESQNSWEEAGTFNPAAIEIGGSVHIIYRAQAKDGLSTLGYARSKNGYKIDERLKDPMYIPREEFEKRLSPGNAGCEDPRIVQIGNRLYMFYTAFDAVNPPQVAVTSISVTDFKDKNWNWDKPTTITPPGIMDKDSTLIPKKVGGYYILLHRIDDVVCADMIDSLDFNANKVTKCIQFLRPRPGMWDNLKVGIAAPPVLTKKGWILTYHGVSHDKVYKVGAVLLDKKDPTTVLARTTAPILEPEFDYEKNGQVSNVVFPCGAVVKKQNILLYYGGADSVVGVATIAIKDIFKMFE